MAEIIQKSIILTFDEMSILLYGMGVSQIEGIYMPERKFNENIIIISLQHLAEAEFIYAGKDKFEIRNDIRHMLDIIAGPQWTDIWKPAGDGGPAFFLYFWQHEIVVSERFWRKKDALRLTLFEQEDFERWREDYQNAYCGN